MCTRPDFGNGRYVCSLLEQAQMNQASRLMREGVDNVSMEELVTINEEAIPDLVVELDEKRKIGFR